MMRPQRRSIIPGASARASSRLAVRFTWSVWSQISSVSWASGIVGEDVDLSHRLHGLRGQALDLAPPAEIRDDELDTRLEALADVGDRRDQLGLVPARDQDIGAR